MGTVALRGRRHEARPARQGERDPPDLLVRRSARADPGRPTGVAARRSRWQRRAVERFRVDDFMAYYRSARDRFLQTLADEIPPSYPPLATYPEPVEHCDVCRWAAECVKRRRDDDHLSLVAGVTARQRRALTGRGIPTLEALGDLPLPVEPPIVDIGLGALTRVREQARIQLEGRREHRLKYELFIPAPDDEIELDRGLASLPPPSPGDLSFDIEGDPYAFDDGLDYLFGILDTTDTFHGHLVARRDRRVHPRCRAARIRTPRRLHHRAARSRPDDARVPLRALRADRAQAPDGPLRHARGRGRSAAAQGRAGRPAAGSSGNRSGRRSRATRSRRWRASTTSSARSTCATRVRASSPSSSGSSSARASDRSRTTSTGSSATTATTSSATWSSGTGWRVGATSSRAMTGRVVPRPVVRDAPLPPEVTENEARVLALVERLAGPAVVPTDPAERSAGQQATWLLAQLLSWHRREDKSMWWDFHRLMDLTPEQLVDEGDPIGLLEPVGALDAEAKGRQTWRYRFPDQDYDIGKGAAFDPAKKQARPDDTPFAWTVGDVVAIDPGALTVDLRRSVAEAHPRAIVALDWVPTKGHQAALFDLGSWVADNGIQASGPVRAGRDLLFRLPPRTGQWLDEPLRRDGESELEAARRLALALDHSTLAIQGPPGSGKTYTGARMVCSLLAAGRRVGITGTSHKVIGNMIRAVLAAADEEGTDVRAVQRGDADRVLDDPRVDARQGHARRPGTPRRRSSEPRGRNDLAVGVAEDGRGGRRAVRRRGRPDLAGERHRRRRRNVEPGPARRPAAARPTAARDPSARCRAVCARPHPRRRGHHATDPGPLPRADVATAPGPVRLHLRGLLRRSARTDAPARDAADDRRRFDPRRHWASAVGRPDDRSRQRLPGRGRRRRRPGAVDRRGRRRVDRRRRDDASDRLGRRPHRRALQRAGRRDQPAIAERGPGRDGRQVPGPGSAGQHLLDDDVDTGAARHEGWTSCTAAIASTSRRRERAA